METFTWEDLNGKSGTFRYGADLTRPTNPNGEKSYECLIFVDDEGKIYLINQKEIL